MENICTNCAGYCCKIFSLSYSFDEMKELVSNNKNQGMSKFEDAKKCLKHLMLLPIKGFDAPYLYTCKAHINGKCSIYEDRMDFCKNFMCTPGEFGRIPKESEMYVGQMKKIKEDEE